MSLSELYSNYFRGISSLFYTYKKKKIEDEETELGSAGDLDEFGQYEGFTRSTARVEKNQVDSDEPKKGSLGNLDGSVVAAQMRAPRGKCKRRKEAWVTSTGGGRRARNERVGDPLSPRGETRTKNGDGGNTCSGRVHAFQGFRESGEYDGGDVSLNI